MRISDWSSDLCSSDLTPQERTGARPDRRREGGRAPVRSYGGGVGRRVPRLANAETQPNPTRVFVCCVSDRPPSDWVPARPTATTRRHSPPWSPTPTPPPPHTHATRAYPTIAP